VTIIEMLPNVAKDMEPINGRALLDELGKIGVTILVRKKVHEVTPEGVVVIDMEPGKNRRSFLTTHFGHGLRSDQALYQSLEGKVEGLYLAGDCNQPGTIFEAVRDSFLIGYHI